MINYTIKLGNKDYSISSALPFKEQFVLDESLDNGVLVLKTIKRATIFKPFTLVEITKNDGETIDTYNYFVASDKIMELVGTNLYTHNLVIIEETKLLEKIIVDTNTATNPLTHDYSTLSNLALVKNIWISGTTIRETNYYSDKCSSVYLIGSITFPTLNNFLNLSLSGVDALISITNIKTQQVVASVSGTDTELVTNLDIGDYLVVYFVSGPSLSFSISASFQISIIYQFPQLPYLTITEIVNKLLAISETLRVGEMPRFTFNTEQAQYYSTVLAPEFSLTKSTLRECLDQIGGYIHCIVRLANGIIYYDKLGGSEIAELPTGYISHQETQDIEQYCSAIDTNVDNLVNIDNEALGTILEPFNGGYETVRTETGIVRITDTSAIIETEYPIEKIAKVEVGYLSDETLVGDITACVYEEAEYLTLSSTENIYPLSKAYAIYYTQGEKNIKGLGFNLKNLNPISPIFETYAIINIIERKTGNLDIVNIFNTMPLINLSFRITYYPIVNARIKQTKSDLTEYDLPITSIYNQSANKVDSEAYGENLKGAVARLGNIEKVKTYILPKIALIPSVGMLVDNDYYIATVSVENMQYYFKVTCGLSKDFNRLNKYIGIKNNLRLYEVSEKQSVERYVIYEDYCVIGNSIVSESESIIKNDAVVEIANSFTNATQTNGVISVAQVQGETKNNQLLQKVNLPVVSLGIGNSLYFAFRFKDNYSAGNTSEEATTGTGSAYYRVQNYVPYGDFYGRIENLNLELYDTLAPITDYATAQSVGNALPKATLTPTGSPLATTGTAPIILKKDSRENINMGYQVHFITNQQNFIIGSYLSLGSPLVSSAGIKGCSLYIFQTRINKFSRKMDLTNATLVKDYNGTTEEITATNNQVVFNNQIANANGNAWAIVDNGTNELLFGKNGGIINGETILMPTMTFTHQK